MNCYNKKNQFILSLLIVIGIVWHYYIIDFKCVLFYLMVFAPILMVLPIIWNQSLYNEFSINFKKLITYKSFQCIMTVVLFLLCILILYLLIVGYVPVGYRAGQC